MDKQKLLGVPFVVETTGDDVYLLNLRELEKAFAFAPQKFEFKAPPVVGESRPVASFGYPAIVIID